MSRRRAASLCIAAALVLGGCRGNVRAIEKSMEPTIRSGDLVTVDEHAYDHAVPLPGDIVDILAPAGAETETCGVPPIGRAPCRAPTPQLSKESYVIKRVIAGPGHRVAIARDGTAIVDGERLDEPYVQPCGEGDACALPHAVRVPSGHWFVLGDNRPYSSDSRYWGPVPRHAIRGRVDPARGLGD